MAEIILGAFFLLSGYAGFWLLMEPATSIDQLLAVGFFIIAAIFLSSCFICARIAEAKHLLKGVLKNKENVRSVEKKTPAKENSSSGGQGFELPKPTIEF